MRHSPVRVAVVLVLAASAGCSSGDDDASSTSPPSVTGSASTSDDTADQTGPATTDGSSDDTSDETSADGTADTTAVASATTGVPSSSTIAPIETTPAVTVGGTIAPTTAPGASVPSTTGAPAETTTTIELTPDERGDVQLAESALINIRSFPDGWTSEPAGEDPDNEEFEQKFDACFGRTSDSPTEALSRRSADSDEFLGTGETRPSVEHSVSMAPDEDIALLAMSEVATDGASDCLAVVVQEFFEAEFADDADVPDGLTLGEVTIERTDDGARPDLLVGYRLTVPFSVDDVDVAQYLDVVYQRAGRAVSSLQFASFGTPFVPDGIDALTVEVEEKIARIGIDDN